MELAPSNILNAALETIHSATVCARNWTQSGDFPLEAVNELMDAIHEIPQMIRRWEHDKTDDIVTHLNSFDVRKWRETIDLERHSIPDFAHFFKQRLDYYSNSPNTGT